MTTNRRGGGAGGGEGTGGGGKRGGEGRPKLRSSHASGGGEGPKRPTKKDGFPKLPPARVSVGPKTRKARPSPAQSHVSSSIASDESRSTAVTIAIAALDKKAVGIEILDVAGRVDYADFLVLMTGRSDRQVAALAAGIDEALKKKGRRAISIEGLAKASWVLMDYGDVVVHVFQDDARSLYDIDGLWLDARRVPVPVPDSLR